MRMSTASIQPPRKPASRPRATPTNTDSNTEAMPTASEMRAPYMRADRMSRPWSSVPSTKLRLPPSLQAGGRRALPSSSVVRSNGLWGATQGANTAQNKQTAAMTDATMAVGEVRKLWPTSLSSQRKSMDFTEKVSLMKTGNRAPAFVGPARCG
jgi:hypothetical protein